MTTPYVPSKPARRPIEWKVKVATIATYAGSLALLGALQAVSSDKDIFGAIPAWLGVILTPVIPTAITAVSAYVAKHTPRPDLEMPQPLQVPNKNL